MTPPDALALERAASIRLAADALRRGGLVVFPTETVYGLGAHACDPDAVTRIFRLKGRPPDNPLIVHVADAAQLADVARETTPLATRLAERFWPGPLTIVLDADPRLPAVTTGGHATVGVRVPAHPVALRLLEQAALPVAAPSANRSGRPSPTTAAHVLADLGDHVDMVLDGGPCLVGLESTVVDARGDTPVVLREGAVTREQLAAGLSDSDAASPGTRYRHYAPKCRVVVAEPGELDQRVATEAATGLDVGVVAPITTALPPGVQVVARFSTTAELAQRLYESFHEAERAGIDVLVVSAVPPHGLGRAVMDRLVRAAEPPR